MLKSFLGTYDQHGLTSLKVEDAVVCPCPKRGQIPFWAVVDTSELPEVAKAIDRGERSVAFEMLASRAKDIAHF